MTVLLPVDRVVYQEQELLAKEIRVVSVHITATVVALAVAVQVELVTTQHVITLAVTAELVQLLH